MTAANKTHLEVGGSGVGTVATAFAEREREGSRKSQNEAEEDRQISKSLSGRAIKNTSCDWEDRYNMRSELT
jgi:hypothetical protein